ncbi:MAG: hypothetical protein V8T37_00995 [Streptococcus sp.]
MFLFAQEKSDTIEFLKSELVQLLSNMRQEIAAKPSITDRCSLPSY